MQVFKEKKKDEEEQEDPHSKRLPSDDPSQVPEPPLPSSRPEFDACLFTSILFSSWRPLHSSIDSRVFRLAPWLEPHNLHEKIRAYWQNTLFPVLPPLSMTT